MTSSPDARPPSTREAVLKLLESQRTKVERWKAARIRQVAMESDRELNQVERMSRELESEPSSHKPAPLGCTKKRKSTAALAAERREAVVRLLSEQSEPRAIGEIIRVLGISDFSARRALKRLCEEGRVRRLGTGSATRYEVRVGGQRKVASAKGISSKRASGTLEGRLLTTIQDRASATVEEVAQAGGIPVEEARRICAGLITEGEIEMGRRNGHPVYIARSAA